MNRFEFDQTIQILEESYDMTLIGQKREVWFTLFQKVDIESFKKAIYECIKRYSNPPKPHDVYQILNEMKAIPQKGEWRPVKPHIFYYDQFGRTYQLVSEDGTIKNPPEEIIREEKFGKKVHRLILRRWRSPMDPYRAIRGLINIENKTKE